MILHVEYKRKLEPGGDVDHLLDEATGKPRDSSGYCLANHMRDIQYHIVDLNEMVEAKRKIRQHPELGHVKMTVRDDELSEAEKQELEGYFSHE